MSLVYLKAEPAVHDVRGILPERYVNEDAVAMVLIGKVDLELYLVNDPIPIVIPADSEQFASLQRWLERNGGNF